MNIVHLFFDSAKKYPDKTAIIENGCSVTFSEFAEQVHHTSAYFHAKGISKGDRVMVFVPMNIDLYRIVLALFNIGAVAVFLDEWVSKERMEACCKIAQCKVFIGVFKARMMSLLSKELRKIPVKLGTRYSAVLPGIETTIVDKNETALITFTTGSTGTPKAANRTHGFLHEQFRALMEKIDPLPDDVDMPVLPIVLLINLGAGCTSVIAVFKASKPESMNAKKIVEQLIRYSVNRLVASPFFVKQLAKYMLTEKIKLKQLKKILTGGAPVFQAEAALYEAAFPDSLVEVIYGSTEAEPISSIAVKELLTEKAMVTRGLNVGKPYRKTQVKIIAINDEAIACRTIEELNKLELLPGEIGEIIVSGPHVLQAYINNENAWRRNKIFIDGICWHRTGDSGSMDESGTLYLTGRCNSLITLQNQIIAPFLYENIFASMEGVELGTVLNIGNKTVAVIEPAIAADKKNVAAALANSGLHFDELQFINKIPRDQRHNSKIDYGLLTAILTKNRVGIG